MVEAITTIAQCGGMIINRHDKHLLCRVYGVIEVTTFYLQPLVIGSEVQWLGAMTRCNAYTRKTQTSCGRGNSDMGYIQPGRHVEISTTEVDKRLRTAKSNLCNFLHGLNVHHKRRSYPAQEVSPRLLTQAIPEVSIHLRRGLFPNNPRLLQLDPPSTLTRKSHLRIRIDPGQNTPHFRVCEAMQFLGPKLKGFLASLWSLAKRRSPCQRSVIKTDRIVNSYPDTSTAGGMKMATYPFWYLEPTEKVASLAHHQRRRVRKRRVQSKLLGKIGVDFSLRLKSGQDFVVRLPRSCECTSTSLPRQEMSSIAGIVPSSNEVLTCVFDSMAYSEAPKAPVYPPSSLPVLMYRFGPGGPALVDQAEPTTATKLSSDNLSATRGPGYTGESPYIPPQLHSSHQPAGARLGRRVRSNWLGGGVRVSEFESQYEHQRCSPQFSTGGATSDGQGGILVTTWTNDTGNA
ncbi:uncharacterized protein CLUP02_12138 [Colletotrichum lupini]|uniref:Uncharacterized protein n=1 Tax=Colletotrichum lupini TaxID=145971 RepID=A0A9Q8T1L8_9PEZI|nr:uncharacterized protein CLUP02_12138 [Colletotrichum lupini]UQC86636.1 hypothetical protein CLUP02_12138 [Colletotrichum lupini]